jgi:hypothetical protein
LRRASARHCCRKYTAGSLRCPAASSTPTPSSASSLPIRRCALRQHERAQQFATQGLLALMTLSTLPCLQAAPTLG